MFKLFHAFSLASQLFPNMLPSQFQDQMKREEDLKRKLKGRLELAKYLRDVVEEKAKAVKASDANSVSGINSLPSTVLFQTITSETARLFI